MKRLRALLCENEIGVSAQSPVPSGPGVQEITCALATPEEEAQMSPAERARHEEEKARFIRCIMIRDSERDRLAKARFVDLQSML